MGKYFCAYFLCQKDVCSRVEVFMKLIIKDMKQNWWSSSVHVVLGDWLPRWQDLASSPENSKVSPTHAFEPLLQKVNRVLFKIGMTPHSSFEVLETGMWIMPWYQSMVRWTSALCGHTSFWSFTSGKPCVTLKFVYINRICSSCCLLPPKDKLRVQEILVSLVHCYILSSCRVPGT